MPHVHMLPQRIMAMLRVKSVKDARNVSIETRKPTRYANEHEQVDNVDA
jgi:hypothetical protein